ncbi:hypothetical protein KIH39_10365 [Telmatocola sphagniphila]|uniref:Uncharacterized protein n=1 Tax=Telmatocola sphagniphila TaxID=1123043 RepID=A0A8E6EWS9_9BACT|nr:hypothetical protein [Telmatocola sphagniphila]QVL34285.1 hypothetical protein KIH39_10365 [Telmatocola sphagniphila]
MSKQKLSGQSETLTPAVKAVLGCTLRPGTTFTSGATINYPITISGCATANWTVSLTDANGNPVAITPNSGSVSLPGTISILLPTGTAQVVLNLICTQGCLAALTLTDEVVVT